MPTRRLTALLPLALLAASCGSIGRPPATYDLHAGLGSVPFTPRTPEEIAALRPAFTLPARLAVAPPLARSYHAEHPLTVEHWSERERRILLAAVEPLVERGLVSEVVFLPGLLQAPGARWSEEDLFESLRIDALRERADVLVAVQTRSRSASAGTAVSLLDLAILPAFFVPSHEVEAETAMSAVAFDVRTEYLLASAVGEGEREDHSELAFQEAREKVLERRSRQDALREIAEGLLARLDLGEVPAATERP